MRDRTEELKEGIRDSEDEEMKLVLNSDDDPFFQQVAEVRQCLMDLERFVSEMKTKQLKILGSPLPDDRDVKELQSLRDQIKTRAQAARSHIQKLERKDSGDDVGNMDDRVRKTQREVLSRGFVEVMSRCHEIQSEYRQRNVERIHRQLQITGVTVTEEKMEEMLETGKQEVFTANLMLDTQVTKQTLNEIETRREEIFKLERSIRDLHDMFMYMAMEVEAQGEMIDNIESCVSHSVDYVEKAKTDTRSAVTSQRHSRKKKIMIFVCVSVLVLVIIAVVVGLVA
uniref:Syntaxin-4-like protein n=1 Tax=Callorhinchus milii TaxID=7868 RepID=V9L681_CALMI